MWPNPQLPADLVTFTEEILNGKPHFFSSARNKLKNKCNKNSTEENNALYKKQRTKCVALRQKPIEGVSQ